MPHLSILTSERIRELEEDANLIEINAEYYSEEEYHEAKLENAVEYFGDVRTAIQAMDFHDACGDR